MPEVLCRSFKAEKSLIEAASELAIALNISRSELIREGLRLVIELKSIKSN